MHYEFGNGTDVGCVREKNEDTFALYKANDDNQYRVKGHLAVICDGMGGAQAGAVASAMAMEEVGSVYYNSKIDDPRAALIHAIKEANSKVFQKSQSKPTLKGMGTTVVATSLYEGEAFVAHVGDSRCYHIHNNEISQVTEDHTMVQKMVQQGLITREQAINHPESHILERSVGVGEEVEIDITMDPISLTPGDFLIMCSDGLSNFVSDDEIRQIVVGHSPQKSVEKLIDLAKERGGQDNITVQVIKARKQEVEDEVGTTTVRIAPLRSKIMPLIYILIVLAVLAGAVWALDYFDVISLADLLNLGSESAQ